MSCLWLKRGTCGQFGLHGWPLDKQASPQAVYPAKQEYEQAWLMHVGAEAFCCAGQSVLLQQNSFRRQLPLQIEKPG